MIVINARLIGDAQSPLVKIRKKFSCVSPLPFSWCSLPRGMVQTESSFKITSNPGMAAQYTSV